MENIQNFPLLKGRGNASFSFLSPNESYKLSYRCRCKAVKICEMYERTKYIIEQILPPS